MKSRFFKTVSLVLAVALSLEGCAYTPKNYTPYKGTNPANPQFERGMECKPLDLFGDFLSKILQLVFWTRRYGNHRISAETEKEVEDFLKQYGVFDVKVRINQWAPHKEVARVFSNKKIAIPYRILFFPSTLITSLIARPFSGLLISDYYDPGSNTVHIFSDETSIALHEAGHALDFERAEFRGTYGLVRLLPGINLIQEKVATDEAILYLEKQKKYDELFQSYKVLYPAYSTYIASYIPIALIALPGAVIVGHIWGRRAAKTKRRQLQDRGELPPNEEESKKP